MSQDKKIKYLPGDILVTLDNTGRGGDIIFLGPAPERWSGDTSYVKIRKKTTDELFFIPTIFAEKYYINISGIARTRDEKLDTLLQEMDILS